ncbi:MAG: hypothetical protein NUV78_03140 [Candidatus Zambryskibacteria bacterium]|nr:hypothetical protein [Candidatus Zambryskibacteria bacterium]
MTSTPTSAGEFEEGFEKGLEVLYKQKALTPAVVMNLIRERGAQERAATEERMRATEEKHRCNFLPLETTIYEKYRQEHDSGGENYRWCDAHIVRRVYCTGCGKICYADSLYQALRELKDGEK